MRTTVTLDPDVEQMVRETMHRNRKGFKDTINQAIRQALGKPMTTDAEPFRVSARALNLKPGIDSGRLNQLSDELEIDAFLETTRRAGNS